ncbi:MAG: hypothetical protein J0H01_26265 [Rhizobiales bacterium]|nr:hypothetical protein [Hyphomicrobiales bacterium]
MDANAFDLLRVVTAVAVIFGHSFGFSRNGHDWMILLIVRPSTTGWS